MSDPGDPTIRMPPVGGTPPGGAPPPPGSPSRLGSPGGRWWWVAVGAVVVIAVVVLLIVMLGGDDDDAGDSTTTTSTATTVSTSTSTTVPETTTTEEPATTTTEAPTTTLPGPVIVVDAPDAIACTAPTQVEMSWEADNTESVDITINGVLFATQGPSGTALFPFACDGTPQTYVFTANGRDGRTDEDAVVIEES